MLEKLVMRKEILPVNEFGSVFEKLRVFFGMPFKLSSQPFHQLPFKPVPRENPLAVPRD